MKIDRSRIKKSTLEVPPECQALIEKLWLCSQGELLQELKKIDTWTFGKCELYHWIDILDVCDSILEHAAKRVSPKSWQLVCDLPENEELKELLLWVLHFTTLLIEHSFSRHLYNSVEHLLTLLSSCDLHVVLGVLNLLYMFSKRSNFIARLMPEMRSALLKCLTYLAESWGGRENGFGLADCCHDNPMYCPPSATTVHYEFYSEETPTGRSSQVSCIHLENVDKLDKTPAEIMNSLIEAFNVPSDGQMLLFTHIRLAYAFSDYRRRLYCVQARLQALSVLLYSNSFTEIQNLLYPGILDELVELLELQDPQLVEIRAAALRTLTSITHLDRSPRIPLKPGSRLNMIIDVTGAGLYHGFLPQMVRNCITSLTTEKNSDQFPLPLATALFSFLYHLASYEAGGEALVSCGMMECLLRVINWPGTELEHITFVTRAVRVIDLITNIDMQAFQAHGGLTSFINRLQMEMTICRKEQPFEIQVQSQSSAGCDVDLDEEMMRINVDSDSNPSTSKAAPLPMPSTSTDLRSSHGKTGKTCLPQRAALLKSMLNFLKKALQDPSFSESMRHVMDGSLPSSLKHIISNAEYYGPSLFLLATDVVTAYVFQEPQYLSSLQDNGLTDVVLHALLVKNVPATREVLGSLPNVFSALCLNPRGLASFVRFSPFDRLFKVLLSPMYLSAMRRRRSTDPIGDTASNLGNAMDELMRHQPTLKADATAAIIKLLEELCALGRDPKYICWRPQKGSSGESPLPTPRVPNEAGSSDEEEDDEEEASTSSHPQREDASVDQSSQTPHEKTPIALVDYILNVMKFVDAILSNNSTDDHCREFVNQKGLVPLLSILGLPNLPVDYPVTLAAQSVASVCKSILNLAHEPQVMRQGLSQLNDVLTELKPLYRPEGKRPEGSLLLHELASAPKLEAAFSTPSATPLLHAVAAANGYVVMFVHVCRTGQLDIRTISMTHWGSDLGLQVLKLLCELYTALVWESTILLALCSDDASTSSKFSKDDIDKLFPPEMRLVEDSSGDASGHMTSAMEALSTEPAPTNMEVDEQLQAPKKKGIPSAIQMKYIKPLLGASSRLGRALAELFGLLVKLCVGFPVRTRRGNHLTNTPVSPTPAALEVAKMLATLLATGLNYKSLPPAPMPKFRLTYLICSVGFTSPMLFDEKKFPYHLMLQKFVQCGGQKAFFDTFYWAVSGGNVLPLESGLEHPDLPDGTGEFLDAWLILLEKMVNPKAILESTHMLPTRTTQQGVQKMFDPLKYLQHIHKEAFNAIKLLWGKKPLKTYGPRMIETVLTIMKHILRGEKCIEERKLKEVESNGREANDARRRERPEVNLTELQQLMDMGFSREHCYEALILTATMEHATDYLLNNFFPHNSSRTNTQQPSMETEEDQLYQAIAMSLGESGQSPAETNPSSMSIEEETQVEPIQKEELDKFTEEALPVCLNMLEKLPDTVYHVCSLLNTILRRNGETFSYKLLNALASKINSKVEYLLEACNSLTPEDPDLVSVLVHSLDAHRAAAIIHLYMLLFEDIKVPCAKVVHTSRMLPNLIDLLSRGTKVLARCEAPETPKWMAPLLLLIDLLEKVSQVTTRKAAMHRYTSHVWRWFDLTTGKWTLYSPVNNKQINDAYWRGESLLRIASGRRRYTIIFHQMIQTNEDSGKQRPIMRSLLEPAKEQQGAVSSNELFPSPPEKSPSSSSAESMEVEGDSDFFHRRSAIQSIQGVSPEDAANIVYACVCLMDIPVNKDTLHAAMQLCVRFTRDYQNAKAVAKMGVVKILLKLRQNCVFPGFSGLATILIRHILEEPLTLELAFEKVLRAKTLQNIPPSYKELHYILRECSSAVCRDTAAFRRVAERILRVDLTALNKRGEEEDNRLLMKSVVTNEGRQNLLHVCIEETSRQTVYDLLNALAIVYDDDVEDNCPDKGDSAVCSDMTPTSTTSSSSSEGTSGSRQAVSGSAPVSSSGFDPPSATRSTSSGNQANPFPDLLSSEQSAASGQTSSNSTISAVHQNASLPLYMVAQAQSQSSGGVFQSTQHFQSEQSEAPEKMRKLPLLSKSAILKILGDAVRSYTTIAKLITEYTYSANEVAMIKEDCSAIAFVLDHLMPARDGMTDHELPNMARGLIAALSSCNHSPDAQLTLVSEVKSALARTLAMPESSRKHQHIQDLVGIVTIMIENCPPVPINTPLTSALKLSQFSVNNMVRFMMRKGIITDLSRIPHSLDLSSPKMAATMNAVLKPLESLSRIMSCPSSVATAAAAKLKAKRTVPMPASDEPPSSQTGTSASEATNAQGEETVEDADNTEHDVSAAVDICSEEPINPPDDADEADGDEMIEHLIDRDVPPSSDTDAGEQNTGFIFDESIETSTSDLTYQPMSQNEEASESSSDDSDSNGSEEERRMDDPATDIDDQVDDEEEDEAEGDDNEITDHYAEEVLEMFEAEQGLLGIPGIDHESDDFLMIEYGEPVAHSTPLMPWISSSFSLPFSLFEEASNGNDNASLNQIPSLHPLLMTRQNLDQGGLSSSRTQRLMNRTRRYQYVQMNRSSASPLFLQRVGQGDPVPFIGSGANTGNNSSSSNDVISSAFGNNTRVVVMDNGLGIFTNSEEEQINFVDQSGYLLGPSLAATLNNVPTSMHWWNEEARILDGDSQADCAVVVGYETSPVFLRFRNEELAERREKHKKQDEEEQKKCNTDTDKKKLYHQEIMNIFEQSPRAPPLRPTTRRIAMLTAAQEVAQATENLAGSIVESVLHPRAIEPPHGRQQPSTSYLEVPSGDPSMVHIASSEPIDNTESTVLESSPTASQTLLGDNMRCESMGSISPPPPLLPLTPINAGQSDLSDPLGLIPGSVPFPPPADPDDGFFRVNPPEELQTEQRQNSEDNELGELPPLPCGALDMTNSTPSSTSSSPFVINRINITSMRQVSEDPPLDYEFTVNNWLLPSLPSLNSNSTSQSSLPPPPPLPPSSGTQPQPLQEQQSESNASTENSCTNSSSTTQQNQSNAASASATSGTNVVVTVGNQPLETSSDDNNQEVPEGVDPSFLAALPDELRSEVIAEHLRLQRLRTRAEAQSQSGEVNRGSTIEVNPDFLAALPPNIQEEVLAQQRLEQQRQAATSSNPNEPVDAAAFFQDLPHALRQAILTDMEESQMSVLPPEIVAEAQNLRREWEARNRQLMQERFLSHVTHNTTTLSSILRTPSPRSGSRQSAARYAIQSVSPRSPWTGWPARQDQQTSMNLCAHSRASNVRTRGRQILDYESICCLLVLLFVDDSRLNTVRLHRVFRNLCYHPPTREWIIKALLSIMEKSNEGNSDGNGTGFGHPLGISGSGTGRPVSKRMTTRSQSQIQAAEPNHLSNNVNMRNNSSWLNISMDAALGCRATVFHVQKVPGRRTERTVTINPQAAPFVYRHALDILISLAKTFPSCFVPTKPQPGDEMNPVPTNKAGKTNRVDSSNFWDLLIRLDSVTSKKGKNTTKNSTNQSQDSEMFSLEASPFGQLLRMLAAPVVRRSPVLMDKLLRLLSLISVGLQVNKEQRGSNTGSTTTGGASSNVTHLSYEPIISPNTLNHLSLVIKVLTSNTCSEEGLEDATALLLNISVNIESIRDTVLRLLLQGARSMAENVCEHINALLRELQELNRHHSQSEEIDDNSIESRMSNMKGILSNRFTKDTVVVTAPKKVKSGLDLQLSSMAPLISKTSSQAFFLRVLKVIAQMRESVQNVDPKKNENADDFELECDADCDAETASVLEKSRVQLLSEQLDLDHLWDTLSNCLTELAHTQDSHAVLVLQPAVEAFFLVHASNEKKQLDKERAGLAANNVPSGSQGLSDELAPAPRPLSPLPPTPICNEAAQSSSQNTGLNNDENAASQKTQQKFLKFAETHRTVLNQILRQCSTPLLEGPFAVLVNHTRVLDFDVKRRYFRSELERADEGHRREEIAVHVRRNQIFEDSFRELHRRAADDWKNRFYIVFEGEEGQDAGGLLREWYMIISREIFNPMYALFTTSPGDRVTYMINPASHCNHNHLCYFKFVGRVIAKAIYDNKLLECYFTRSLYKHILGIPVKYTDMESEDYSFYQGLVYMMENHISSLGYDPTFSTEVQEFGVTEVRDLLPNGRNILVTEENKMDYIQLVCKMKMTGAIRQQLQSFLEGFYEIIPKKLISIFNEQELELLISGLPNVDIDELKANTEYYKYQPNSLQIQWFWRALREFDQAERAKFLQFVTGTSKVPLQGFGALEGMNGTQKFQIHRDERSTDRLPSAHTCFNQLDLPVYETYTKLRTYLLKAIHECSEGFGFA